MPCRDGGPYYSNDPRDKQKIDDLTRMLCNVMGALTSNGAYVHGGLRKFNNDAIEQEVWDWWKIHQLDDARRQAEEDARLIAEEEAKEARIKKLRDEADRLEADL